MTITSSDTPNKGKPATEAFSGVEEPIESIEPEESFKPKKKIAKKVILPQDDDRVLMKILSDNFSYTTEGGVIFKKDHPFQLVSKEESDILIRTRQFMYADPKEVEEFYKNAK